MSMTERLTIRDNKTVHENKVCCTHFESKECEERSGFCTDECPWEEAAWSKLADYEDIGTVSEFRELKEKATAKKPIPLDKHGEYHECPTCGCGTENYLGCSYRYCPSCGTEFDWSEGKE